MLTHTTFDTFDVLYVGSIGSGKQVWNRVIAMF